MNLSRIFTDMKPDPELLWRRLITTHLLAHQCTKAEITAQSVIGLSIVAQAHALKNRKITAVALCQAYIDVIKKTDAIIHAFVATDFEKALDMAQQTDLQIENGNYLGLFHGIPFAAKDLFFIDGFSTFAGSKVAMPYQAQSLLINKLIQQGAICIGKLATYEYATVGPAFDLPYEIVKNPFDLNYITGGSSSGSAAAVASKMLRFSLGTDTGGSIRSPSAYCGIIGLKPTFGALSPSGIVPLSPSLDVPGIMGASSLEALMVFNVLAGKLSENDTILTLIENEAAEQVKVSQVDLPLAGIKIGYARAFFAEDEQLDPEFLSAMDNAASVFSSLGALIHEVSFPEYQPLEDAAAVILHAEAYQYHEDKLTHFPEQYGNLARNSLLNGQNVTLKACLDANLVRQQFSAFMAEQFKHDQYDAILTINTLTSAAMISECNNDEPKWSAMRTIAFNLSGNPVLAVPMGISRHGLPMGLQLVGDHFSESKLCQIGMAFETRLLQFSNQTEFYGLGITPKVNCLV